MNDILLPGCTPEPLMSYLKALGIFRLVAEQADPHARLSWRNGVACLRTVLNRDELIAFFSDKYEPTPIVGPWGARSGFYPGSSERSAREALDAIVTAAKSLQRLAPFAKAVEAIRILLVQNGFVEKVRDEDKLTLMTICRNELPDSMLTWLDAVYILTDQDRKFPPLLGTGGNEGSGSYVSTFAQVVKDMLTGEPQDGALLNALFNEFSGEIRGLAVGQLNPGAIGGANSSQGFDGGGGVNKWNYILALEGSLIFAGAAARRYGSDTAGRAAYPFCVEAVPVGYASESEKEAGNSTRAEMWLPLWDQFTTFMELTHLLAEGRVQLGRSQARTAVDFALAVATLGVSRGITSFVRFAFVMRNGLSNLAAPLGRFRVVPRPKARLLDDHQLSFWLAQVRRACSDKEKAPSRYQSALRTIDRSIFNFANRSEHGNDAKYLLAVLEAIGHAEQTLATGLRFAQEKYIRPLSGLSEQWIEQADDGSCEFRLAASLAAIKGSPKGEVAAIRCFLEEVEVTKFVNWSAGSTSAVWSRQSLEANLAGVFRRRQMEASRAGVKGVPIYSTRPAGLDDVIAFLKCETDDQRISDLFWGLICVEYPGESVLPNPPECEIPFEFGVLRLLVEEVALDANTDKEVNAIADPDVFHVLASGQSDAVEMSVNRAARRLKSGGLLVRGDRNRRQGGKPLSVVSDISPLRLLASMLFPISRRDLKHLANSVLYPPESKE